MSGGAFDYRDNILADLQDTIAREIGYMQYGSNSSCIDSYNSKTIEYMKNIVQDLEKLSKVLHSLDWYISGDTSEEKFISDYENLYTEKHDDSK